MNIGVIFAGGSGQRMHSKDRPKQFLTMYGKPIIIYTLEKFENCEDIDAIVIACIEEWIPYLKELLYKYRIEKVKRIVPGGKTGQLSIYNGLRAAKEITGEERSVVLVHDGVRPMISPSLLSECIESVHRFGNAITAGIVTETIAVVDGEEYVTTLPERKDSRVAKAPQCFYLDDILSAHGKALSEGHDDYIDCCTIMTHYGHRLHMIVGPAENIKITTPEDFYIMRAFIEARENEQMYFPEEQ